MVQFVGARSAPDLLFVSNSAAGIKSGEVPSKDVTIGSRGCTSTFLRER